VKLFGSRKPSNLLVAVIKKEVVEELAHLSRIKIRNRSGPS
jgi:hypothetical protein